MSGRQKSFVSMCLRYIDEIYFELCILGAICCTFFFIIFRNIIIYLITATNLFGKNSIAISTPMLLVYWLLILLPYAALVFIAVRRIVKRSFVKTLLIYRLGRVVILTPRLLLTIAAPAIVALVILFGMLALQYSPIPYNRYASPLAVMLTIMSALVLFGLLDQLSRVLLAVRDVSKGNPVGDDKLALYKDIKRAIDNLATIEQGMHEAVLEQTKAERFKTDLIANVSHDIKTPLTSIVNYVELLKKEQGLSPSAQEYLEILSRNAWRLGTLASDLVEASKTSTGNVNVSLQPTALVEFVLQAYGGFDGAFAQKELEFVFDGDQAERMVLVDGTHLWRVMENLFSNVVKYASPRSRVYCQLTQENGFIALTFKNISEQPLNISVSELMERFVRGDRARHTEGSGLGLFIARGLVSLMGGELALRIDGDLFEVKMVLVACEVPPIEAAPPGR